MSGLWWLRRRVSAGAAVLVSILEQPPSPPLFTFTKYEIEIESLYIGLTLRFPELKTVPM